MTPISVALVVDCMLPFLFEVALILFISLSSQLDEI